MRLGVPAGPQAITAQNAWVRWLPNNLPAAAYVTLVVFLILILVESYANTGPPDFTQRFDEVLEVVAKCLQFTPGAQHIAVSTSQLIGNVAVRIVKSHW